MRVPLSWLAEYVDLPADVTPESVAAALVRVGLEEEGILGASITGPVVVGRVLTKTPEPQKNGKVINWCTVDVGRGPDDPQGVICGAHNFDAGDDVVVAMPGAVLPGDFVIAERKTYGHISAGMICSAAELGLGTDHSGIIVLAERGFTDVRPGQDALPLLGLAGLDASGVEVNVNPDRGYCFSIRGIAREYAHATRQPVAAVFHDPAKIDTPEPTEAGFPVVIADGVAGQQGCARFVAVTVRGIDGAATSPQWMQRRLEIAGMRPISLVVDVTNYVMLALGQPLHAYDLATLDASSGITVRAARAGEQIETLDGVTRTTADGELVIADGANGARIIGLAGVMGGAATEVTSSTTDVVLEGAWFAPVLVARAGRHHKLSSEASKRFERGVDPQLQRVAVFMAAQLLVEHGGGTIDADFTDIATPVPVNTFEMPISEPERIIGVAYTPETVVDVVSEIGCQVAQHDGVLTVTAPSWRPDLVSSIDLVEEVARVVGYDQIPSVVPASPGTGGLDFSFRVRRSVSDLLAAQGLHEVLTYPFVAPDRADAMLWDEADARRNQVRLRNPLNAELPLMRSDLLSTLVEALQRNVSRGASDVSLFEVGQVCRPGATSATPELPVSQAPSAEQLASLHAAIPHQSVRAAAVLSGERQLSGWQGAGRAADYADAIELVHLVAQMHRVPVTVQQAEHAPWHPGRCAQFTIAGTGTEADGQVFGYAGELHPKVVAALNLPARTCAFEIDLEVLATAADRRAVATKVSTFPVVKEDIALIVDQKVSAADVVACLQTGGGDLLESVRLFDIYTDDKLGEAKKSLAFALRMRADNRTLDASESARVRGAAVAAAQAQFGAVLRDK